MLLIGKKVGFALTGAFYTFEKTILQISRIVEEGADVLPIMSFNSYNIDSKFGKSKYFVEKIEKITGKKVVCTIEEAESIGPKNLTDIMVIAPCSRKHNRKIGKWYYRYTSFSSCKVAFKK